MWHREDPCEEAILSYVNTNLPLSLSRRLRHLLELERLVPELHEIVIRVYHHVNELYHTIHARD